MDTITEKNVIGKGKMQNSFKFGSYIFCEIQCIILKKVMIDE